MAIAKTVTDNQINSLGVDGTLPPSATACVSPTATSLLEFSSNCPRGQIAIPGSGVDTVSVSAVRTALPAANNYRYKLSGSVSTPNASDSTKVVTLSLDDGSYIDIDEADSASSDSKVVAAVLAGTARTAATKFTGTLTLGSFMRSAAGGEFVPTSIVFDGSIGDTSGGSASAAAFLTGKLEVSVADYDKYYTNGIPATGAVAGATSYVKATIAFTGTVQAPSRPLLKLVLSGTQTGLDTGTLSLDYSYDNVVISGTGSFDDRTKSTRLTLTNQDGIQTVITSSGGNNYSGTVTRSGATLAAIANNSINYADGYSESLR